MQAFAEYGREGNQELIQRLCTQAGTIMEDANADALITIESGLLTKKLMKLAEAAEAISAIVAAAQALHRLDHEGR